MYSKNASSPMRGNEEDQLVNSLKEIIDYERELEDIKQHLASNLDFNMEDAFSLFDFTSSGQINHSDLVRGFNIFGVNPSDSEIKLIMQ